MFTGYVKAGDLQELSDGGGEVSVDLGDGSGCGQEEVVVEGVGEADADEGGGVGRGMEG